MTDLPVDAPAVGGSSPSASGAPEPMFPARRTPTSWPATQLPRDQAARLLVSPPFAAATAKGRCKRSAGVSLLLEWLADQPGESWQRRWLASGAEQAARAWRRVPTAWLAEHGHGRWHQEAIVEALPVAISADLVRPSLPWLVGGGPARGGRLVSSLETFRDPDGFARLRALCDDDASVSAAAATQTLYRSALVLAAKGGVLADVTVGDVVELLDAQARVLADAPTHRALFYRLLRSLGIFGTDAPATLRALRTRGQHTPEELIDRYGLACRPIRDLLVDYLRERQPALDYTSLVALSYHLGKRFWADLERHHPGIDSLHLPRAVADDW